ncbi:resolvase [Escherichia coli]|nr:resolvase [Escherichia coli]
MLGNPWGVGRHAHLALVHTSIEHSRDWCRSLLILDCQELAAQQPLHSINWCSRLLKMTVFMGYTFLKPPHDDQNTTFR